MRFHLASNAGVEVVEKKRDPRNQFGQPVFRSFIQAYSRQPNGRAGKVDLSEASKIAALLRQEHGVKIEKGCVRRLLHKHGFCKRKRQKKLSTEQYARRNEQFNIIFYLMALMNCTDGPILCMDTKKKEVLGNLYRAGKCYAKQAVKVFDHDYPHLPAGKVIPHGIYDLKANAGYISIGTSHETAAFVCDNLIWWWDNIGIHLYPAC